MLFAPFIIIRMLRVSHGKQHIPDYYPSKWILVIGHVIAKHTGSWLSVFIDVRP